MTSLCSCWETILVLRQRAKELCLLQVEYMYTKLISIEARINHYASEYMYMKDCAYSALCPEKDTKASRIIAVCTQLKCCDSSVGRGLHQYCRGQGFKAHSGLNFLTATQLACVYNCDDHSCLSRSTVQILLS